MDQILIKQEETDEVPNEPDSMFLEDSLDVEESSFCIKQDPELKHLNDSECDVRSNRVPTPYHSRRISTQQRELMLDFMITHPELGTGRFTGSDATKHRKRLLKELAKKLNSLPIGVTKSEDKWMKSWQDWKSDVKTKAFVLKKEMNKTGGGISSNVKPLTPLEEKLVNFLGPCVVSGNEEVPDPLTIACQDLEHGLDTQTDKEEESPVEVNESFVHNIDSNKDLIMLPLEDSTTMSGPADVSPSGHVPTPMGSPPLILAEENVPSPSGCVPASHESKLSCPSTSAKKRKRSMGGTSAQDEDPLVAITQKQVKCMQDQNALRQEKNDIARAQLQLEERKTVAIENAAEAFIGAMKVLEEYLRHRRGNE